jgi:hypothetical protein
MIIAPMPTFDDAKIQEEVRKALINIAAQLNAELDAIRAKLPATP